MKPGGPCLFWDNFLILPDRQHAHAASREKADRLMRQILLRTSRQTHRISEADVCHVLVAKLLGVPDSWEETAIPKYQGPTLPRLGK